LFDAERAQKMLELHTLCAALDASPPKLIPQREHLPVGGMPAHPASFDAFMKLVAPGSKSAKLVRAGNLRG
jgi:hypothetical protein